jgi:multiple sugar transport system ATP-binding protein
MNLYEASVDASGGLALGSQRLELGALPAALAARAGQKVVVGIRPEDLTMAAAGAPASASAPLAELVADVRMVESLGSELHAFFRIDAPAAGDAGTEPAVAEEVNLGLASLDYNGVARLAARSGVRAGDRVTFGVNIGQLHFFDGDTGRAIR